MVEKVVSCLSRMKLKTLKLFLQDAMKKQKKELKKLYTHLKFNIVPEKLPSQKESSLPTIIFQGLC